MKQPDICHWERFSQATTPSDLRAFYESILPELRRVARQHGYAIAVHGSLRRDLDVIAVPWVEDASSWQALAEAVADALCAFPFKPAPIRKPQGRFAYLLPLGLAAVLDLSVTTGWEEAPGEVVNP